MADLIPPHGGLSEPVSRMVPPEESAEYRQFVLSVAQRVAEAGKEGGFLGIGGTRVSAVETRAIEEIAAALGAAA